MDYEKYFLQSKTVLAALLAVAVQILPLLGIGFDAQDGALVTVAWDQIVTAILGLLAIYFRIVTPGAKLAMKPSSVDTTLRAPWIVTMVAVMLTLAACSTVALEGKTPLEKLRLTYDSAQTQIEIYASLPPCEGGVALLCSKADVVAKLTDLSAQALGYLELAEAAAADPAVNEEDALKVAQNELRKLLTVLALQALTKV